MKPFHTLARSAMASLAGQRLALAVHQLGGEPGGPGRQGETAEEQSQGVKMELHG